MVVSGLAARRVRRSDLSSVMMTIEQYVSREGVRTSGCRPYPDCCRLNLRIASSTSYGEALVYGSPAGITQVPDLAAQGFALLGGRVDVVGQDPVATIIYKHAAHTLSLTTLRPAVRLGADDRRI